MDSRSSTAEPSQHSYTISWPHLGPANPVTADANPLLHHTPIELIPILLSQHSAAYQSQLLSYNRLFAPGRDHPGPRSRSSSKVSNRDLPSTEQTAHRNCHGNKPNKIAEKPDRVLIARKESLDHPKMPPKQGEGAKVSTNTSSQNNNNNNNNSSSSSSSSGGGGGKNNDTTAINSSSSSSSSSTTTTTTTKTTKTTTNTTTSNSIIAANATTVPSSSSSSSRPSNLAAKQHPPTSRFPPQASSVPSTPHQHARNYSFEDREQSPNAIQNHSPRSTYSESNAVPTFKQLPPRVGGCAFESAMVRGRRRMPYSLGDRRLEPVEPAKIKSKLSGDEERRLTTDMRELYDRLKPTDKVKANREKLVKKLEKMFNDHWPGHSIQVHLFGSSGNKLCSDDSDVDICITTDWKDLENVCMIAQLLQKRGMEKVVCVSSAKVPIVKIWDPELGLACDMNVNNTLALENTRMVLTYVEIDERVRPLAMIIKHWTRRRIINDAAFGGTLSSYTWICMIIAFLQLRDPPILPALHQSPYKKRQPENGKPSEFADDLPKLRGFGEKNKETLGELLFYFFRFYAHEFDYGKSVLSVRLGKPISKDEKGWTYSLNNMLCVEEPFNTIRNLGNTADDTSFRGLHLELRRAFDLIAEAKLDECCEQFVFPKEEERVWQKPAAAPRPVLVRSSSQQNSNRGGRGNYRGGGRNHRGNSRRASSSVAYENNSNNNNPAMAQAQAQATFQPTLMQDGQWYAHPQYQYITPEGFVTPAMYSGTAIPLDQNTLRLQQLYSQHWVAAQHQAINMANLQQRMGNSSNQPTDRSRAGSFDQPPLSAPIRPELTYIWPPYISGQFYQPGLGTYTSSPSSSTTTTTAAAAATTAATATATTTTAPASQASDFRRSLHRNTVTGESGGVSSSSTLRSQSQPASRSAMPINNHAGAGQAALNQANGKQSAAVGGYVYATNGSQLMQSNGSHVGFMTNEEAVDTDVEAKSASESPPPTMMENNGHAGFMGYYVSDGSSPVKKQMPNGIPNGLVIATSTLGELPPNMLARRRLSSEQSPQSVLDRRMKRTSRSPSPLGHTRTFSAGNTVPVPTGALHIGNGSKLAIEAKPVVVNGSASQTTASPTSSRQPSASESVTSETPSVDASVCAAQGRFGVGSYGSSDKVGTSSSGSTGQSSVSSTDRPLVVNGSSAAMTSPPAGVPDAKSFNQRVAAMNQYYVSPVLYHRVSANTTLLPQFPQLSTAAKFHAMHRTQQQNGVIAPLDLAMPEYTMSPSQISHLSPVYETRTPSPTVVRKFDGPPPASGMLANALQSAGKNAQAHSEGSKAKSNTTFKHEVAKSNGHGHTSAQSERTVPKVETAISPTTNVPSSDWQKTRSRKKQSGMKSPQLGGSGAEQLPKNEADRKGG